MDDATDDLIPKELNIETRTPRPHTVLGKTLGFDGPAIRCDETRIIPETVFAAFETKSLCRSNKITGSERRGRNRAKHRKRLESVENYRVNGCINGHEIELSMKKTLFRTLKTSFKCAIVCLRIYY